MGSISNGDGDGNENGRKAIGLDWQNSNSACDHAFLYLSLPSLHGYDVKLLISRFMEDGNTCTTTSFCFFVNLDTVL